MTPHRGLWHSTDAGKAGATQKTLHEAPKFAKSSESEESSSSSSSEESDPEKEEEKPWTDKDPWWHGRRNPKVTSIILTNVCLLYFFRMEQAVLGLLLLTLPRIWITFHVCQLDATWFGLLSTKERNVLSYGNWCYFGKSFSIAWTHTRLTLISKVAQHKFGSDFHFPRHIIYHDVGAIHVPHTPYFYFLSDVSFSSIKSRISYTYLNHTKILTCELR